MDKGAGDTPDPGIILPDLSMTWIMVEVPCEAYYDGWNLMRAW